MSNSVDPDQLASEEANWSGSTLFAQTGHIQVQQDLGKIKNKIKSIFQISLDCQGQLLTLSILPLQSMSVTYFEKTKNSSHVNTDYQEHAI